MFGFIYRSAFKDFFRPGRIVVWALIALAVFAIGSAWQHLSAGQPAEVKYGQLSNIFVFRMLALAAAIFSTMVVSQDVEQKTIVYTLTRNVQRPVVLLARMLAAITSVAIVSALFNISGGLAIFGGAAFGQSMVWYDVLITTLGAFAYCSLFVFISLLMNRAMIVCLLFAFGWETFVPNMPGDLYYLSISTYMKGMAQHPMPKEPEGITAALSGQVAEKLVPQIPSIIVLVMITVVFTAMSVAWFRAFEYSPREDAE